MRTLTTDSQQLSTIQGDWREGLFPYLRLTSSVNYVIKLKAEIFDLVLRLKDSKMSKETLERRL